MDMLRTLARSFCAACFVAGIAVQLLEGSSLRKCIKAVTGLYILVIVLRGIRFLPSQSVTASAAFRSSEFDFANTMAQYETAVLDQSSDDLAKELEHRLYLQGIHASVQLTLQTGPEGVTVRSVRLTMKDVSYRTQAEAYLRQELQIDEIVFEQQG